jgi:AcrR family transcriptional regulator
VSGTQDWRARRWDDTHQRIYDAALRLFEEQGFEHVSVGHIVAAAGVSGPTFYAHYQSKEHLVMQLPTAEQLTALLATEPAELPTSERIRRAVPVWFASWTPDYRAAQLVRWRLIATTPLLRTRAAQFERTTAEMVTDALPAERPAAGPAESIVVNAYLTAYTAGLLAWADGNGERPLEELIGEAFDALDGR